MFRTQSLVALCLLALLEALAPVPGQAWVGVPAARIDQVLEQYREIAGRGGWPSIPAGPELREGARGPRVRLLRTRLGLVGDLDPDASAAAAAPHADPNVPGAADPELFDAALAAAVARFQRRHRLEETRAVGKATLRELNVPAKERLRQLELNVARWRLLPPELGRRAVLVNIPDFRLTAFEDGKAVLTMKVIVGKAHSRTPAFVAAMNEVIFYPYWYVPTSIARGEILAKIKKDRGYLARQRMQVLGGAPGAARTIDPKSVDWGSLTPRTLPYRFVQRPGPGNALGRLKFSIPNRFNVYLHDTPEPALFDRERRAFSHGCIRLERPVELAVFVLEPEPQWDEASVDAALQAGKHRKVPLSEELPVYILYWTAWVDADGVVQFREDLYRRDREPPAAPLHAALSPFDVLENDTCGGD